MTSDVRAVEHHCDSWPAAPEEAARASPRIGREARGKGERRREGERARAAGALAAPGPQDLEEREAGCRERAEEREVPVGVGEGGERGAGQRRGAPSLRTRRTARHEERLEGRGGSSPFRGG